jgi:uncharacterized protein (DUF302 family)
MIGLSVQRHEEILVTELRIAHGFMTASRMIFAALLAVSCAAASAQTSYQSVPPPVVGPSLLLPGKEAELPPNTMLAPVPPEFKRHLVQMFMMFSPLSVRDFLNLMAYKVPVKPGLTVDEVAAAIIARAEKHGFLLVNRYQMWKELEARTGKPTPYKVEVISICDPLVSRAWMDYAPEMALFVPPRIAIVEDRNHQLWLLMMDWDVHWIDTAPNAGFDPKLREQGIERREMLEDILRAGANGEK